MFLFFSHDLNNINLFIINEYAHHLDSSICTVRYVTNGL